MTSIANIKKASGAYIVEDGGLFVTIGFNSENSRFEARVYTRDYNDKIECVAMFAHSKRLILAARPALKMVA